MGGFFYKQFKTSKMDKKMIEMMLDNIQSRLKELYTNTEIGGDDMDDFNCWIDLIRKELMYYQILKDMKNEIK
jgi:hypothetical protein